MALLWKYNRINEEKTTQHINNTGKSMGYTVSIYFLRKVMAQLCPVMRWIVIFMVSDLFKSCTQ